MNHPTMILKMGLHLISKALREKYRIDEREHAVAILKTDFREQFDDIIALLDAFWLKKSYIDVPGGSRSPVSIALDGFLSGVQQAKKKDKRAKKTKPVAPIGPVEGRGWAERKFDIKIELDGHDVPIPTHKIDNFKRTDGDLRGIGLEVEWNNKDPFYDRDLNNFRLLRGLGALSVGVIITRLTELQTIFVSLGRGSSYGNSTTHWDKLMPRVDGGGAGGCPLLLIGIGLNTYKADE